MAKSPGKKPSNTSSTSQGRQFSISSFLPKGYGPSDTAASAPIASTSAAPTKTAPKEKKRKSEVDEIVLSDDEEEEEFKLPALPVKKKGRDGKGKAGNKKGEEGVLDLTFDGDLPLPPSTSASKTKTKVASTKGKGKAKAEEADERPSDPQLEAGGMWVDQYSPRDRDDLALHPRKLLDVQTWLCEAFALPLPEPKPTTSKKSSAAAPKPPPPVNPKLAKYRRVLVLSGAAGSAKTAALKVLCEEMDVQTVEWTESMKDEFGGAVDGARESLIHRFSSFLAQAGMAPALDFGDFEDSSSSSSSSTSTPRNASSSSSSTHPPPPNTRRLILLEDLPNVSHYPTKLALRSAIAQYLASSRVTCPLVIVISEALARPGTDDGGGVALGGNGGRGDSVDARSVLGVEILQHPACREIPFNPTATTIMRKALQRTLDRIYAPLPSSTSSSKSRSSKSSSSRTIRTVSGLDPSTRPSLTTLDFLIKHSNGDVRSALMSLQFLATQGGGDATSLGLGAVGGAKAKAKKPKKRKRGSSDVEDSDEDEGGKMGGKDKVQQLLQFVTARESSLFIFHALGKVLYNKRWGDSTEDDKKDLGRPGVLQEREYDKLPKHLRKAGWQKKASKVDPDMLFAEAPLDPDIFLSYLHHNYPPFTNDIEECGGILEGLSAGDAMMLPRGSGVGEGEDAYRRSTLHSHYAFHLSVRSTLLSLPSPVPRRKQTLRKSELWETLRLARQNEEGVAELLGMGANLGAGMGGSGGGLSGTSKLVYASCAHEEGVEGGLVTRRESGSLMSEVLPWLGVIKPKHANPFLLDLATFPPLASAAQPIVTGEALGEKDLEDEEDVGEDAPPEPSTGDGPPATAVRGKTLQEVEEEDEDEAQAGEGPADAAGLFDSDDDIEE
ncbi:hypothetical protein JCM6882_009072 [Rhodosporidiobolus microsporus]